RACPFPLAHIAKNMAYSATAASARELHASLERTQICGPTREPAMKNVKPSPSKPNEQAAPSVAKCPFDIQIAIPRLREAVRPYPKAALFELAAEGYSSVFEVLVACIISIRTRDETTLPVARMLFARARTPAALAALPVEELDALISASTFHEAKA